MAKYDKFRSLKKPSGKQLPPERIIAWIEKNFDKPVVAFIAGRTAPPERRMGHAGAIIGSAEDTAQAKIERLRAAGVHVADVPTEIGPIMARLLG